MILFIDAQHWLKYVIHLLNKLAETIHSYNIKQYTGIIVMYIIVYNLRLKLILNEIHTYL